MERPAQSVKGAAIRKRCESRLLRVPAIAQLLGTSEQAVRNALSRGEEGKTIPRSFKLGSRRVWLRREAMRWLNDLGRNSSGG